MGGSVGFMMRFLNIKTSICGEGGGIRGDTCYLQRTTQISPGGLLGGGYEESD